MAGHQQAFVITIASYLMEIAVGMSVWFHFANSEGQNACAYCGEFEGAIFVHFV